MTERCADLDEFFDGELAADQADRFRDHLATCERCQDVLHGRMQESIAARVPAVAPPVTVPGRVAAVSEAAPVRALGRKPGEPARRRWVRALTYAAPLVAAAAAIPLWLIPRGDRELTLSLDIAPASVPDSNRADSNRADSNRADSNRNSTAHLGDILRPSAHGARAIGVYLGERLIAACPGDARCSAGGGDLALALPLTDRGRYTILALGPSDPLPALRPTLDQTRAAARRAGVRTELQYVEVE